jgi:hypothetical protein
MDDFLPLLLYLLDIEFLGISDGWIIAKAGHHALTGAEETGRGSVKIVTPPFLIVKY